MATTEIQLQPPGLVVSPKTPGPFDDFSLTETSRSDGTTVLAVAGDVDLVTAGDLKASLDTLAMQRRAVLLDLSAERFMDFTGLHILQNATRTRARDEWSFRIARDIPDGVGRLLDLTNMRALLAVEDPS